MKAKILGTAIGAAVQSQIEEGESSQFEKGVPSQIEKGFPSQLPEDAQAAGDEMRAAKDDLRKMNGKGG